MSWTCGKVQVRRGQIKRHKTYKKSGKEHNHKYIFREDSEERAAPVAAARLIKLSELSDSEYVSAKLIRVGL